MVGEVLDLLLGHPNLGQGLLQREVRGLHLGQSLGQAPAELPKQEQRQAKRGGDRGDPVRRNDPSVRGGGW